MAIVYTWNFPEFEVIIEQENKTNIVKNIHWILVGKDGSYEATNYGSVALDPPVSQSFVEFENLTEEIVLSWIENKLDVESIKVNIENSINKQKNPVMQTLTPPWL